MKITRLNKIRVKICRKHSFNVACKNHSVYGQKVLDRYEELTGELTAKWWVESGPVGQISTGHRAKWWNRAE